MQSTQLRDKIHLPTKLDRVEKRAQQDKLSVFNNLGHILDKDLLRSCYHGLDGKKAVGIDGVTKEAYGTKLDENLERLLDGIRRGSYHPKPSRITEIPKADGTRRPLAISCFEDKIVQEAVRRTVEKVYEPCFLECSWGFRPKRNAHMALAILGRHLTSRKDCGAVVDIDLRKYFNTIPHEPLIQILRSRITDQRFLYLIIKLLKAPILNADGQAVRSEIGSPQGSILSPLLANIYLHYVLDEWFEKEVRPRTEGKPRMVRYADDVVFTFPSLEMAKRIAQVIAKRLNKYGLSINESKTRIIYCGPGEAVRHERLGLRMPSFTFLGFAHVWGKSRNRKTGENFWRIKRRTCPKRFRKKLKEILDHIKQHRHQKTLIPRMIRVTQGYLNYFAVSDNGKRTSQFIHEVKRALFKWLNRRSQRRGFRWDEFAALLERVRFPKDHIRVNLLQLSRSL